MDQCAGCGFEYLPEEAPGAAQAIVDGVHEHVAILTAAGGDPGVRRDPDRWSPLEYACHVRDLLLVQRERVLEARRTERPSFSPMGRDERVLHDGYATQDPVDVARQLDDAARMLANVLRRLDQLDWERTVLYNFPVPTERTLRWVAVHTVHEVHHHLLDVRRQMEPLVTEPGR